MTDNTSESSHKHCKERNRNVQKNETELRRCKKLVYNQQPTDITLQLCWIHWVSHEIQALQDDNRALQDDNRALLDDNRAILTIVQRQADDNRVFQDDNRVFQDDNRALLTIVQRQADRIAIQAERIEVQRLRIATLQEIDDVSSDLLSVEEISSDDSSVEKIVKDIFDLLNVILTLVQ